MARDRDAAAGPRRTRTRRALAASCVVTVLAAVAIGAAQGALTSLNDLFALGQGFGQMPTKAPVAMASIGTHAVPRAVCGPGSHPEPGIQGRVPAGSATNGLWCNVTLVSHQGSTGGFKVLRYVDATGHTCAFYDSTLLFGLNAVNPAGLGSGVVVLDMSDPAHPVQTDSLTALPMLSPHESLNLNQARGLLAADNGNPATEPGFVSIYDVHQDCRHPVLDSTTASGRLGHESGFSIDGKTFYVTSTATPGITAVDVTDPKNPHAIWQGFISSHGMSLSDDGNRAYIADSSGGDMLILDTSQIQARKPSPQAREISRLTWPYASIPQNAIPFTENGKPYVLEFDEYTAGTLHPGAGSDSVGAARIIDISDETKPRVVSNIRLQVNQPADHAAAAGDPGALSPVQGYAAHYCNIPTRVNPKVVACSFIVSGLRVFDISDLSAPTEIAYFVAPTEASIYNGYTASDFAMSQPAFAPDQREIWYTDGPTGFYDVRVASDVWPADAAPAPAPGAACIIRKPFLVRVRVPQGAHVRSVSAKLGSRRARIVRRKHALYAQVNWHGTRASALRLIVRVRLTNGRRVTTTRVYRRCVRHRRARPNGGDRRQRRALGDRDHPLDR